MARRRPGSSPAFRLALLVVVGVLELMLPAGKLTTFGGSFIVDDFARFLKILALIGSAATLILSAEFLADPSRRIFEYAILVLLSTLGMMVLISAGDLIMLYLGLELMSLALYVVAASNRDNAKSTEAGLKYFVLGALSSGMLLYGASLIYGFTGTVSFAGIAAAAKTGSIGIVFGLVFLLAGLCFKVSAVPFHMWTPDVYEGAPTPVTAFFASAPKVAALAVFTRVALTAFPGIVSEWQQIVVFVAIASMVLGSFAAIGQTNIKRLMAYSSIGHMGFALVGLAAGTVEGAQGVLVYIAIYVAMTLGTFAVILTMKRNGQPSRASAISPGCRAPIRCWRSSLRCCCSRWPAFRRWRGSSRKFYVFVAAIKAGLFTLAVIGVLASVVGAYYYLTIIKVMYFDEPLAKLDPMRIELRTVLAVAGLFNIFFFVYPGPLVSVATSAAKSLFLNGIHARSASRIGGLPAHRLRSGRLDQYRSHGAGARGRVRSDVVRDDGADGWARTTASRLDRAARQSCQQRPRSDRRGACRCGDAGLCRRSCARDGTAASQHRSIAEVGGIGTYEVFAEMAERRSGRREEARRYRAGSRGCRG